MITVDDSKFICLYFSSFHQKGSQRQPLNPSANNHPFIHKKHHLQIVLVIIYFPPLNDFLTDRGWDYETNIKDHWLSFLPRLFLIMSVQSIHFIRLHLSLIVRSISACASSITSLMDEISSEKWPAAALYGDLSLMS